MMNDLAVRVDKDTLQQMEAVATQCQLQTLDALGQFERMFKMAAGIRALEQLITPAMMEDVVALQNKPIGFRTDKDGGYPIDVLKSCIIEAVLRGLRTVGNEFNIIAGRLYITKEGMARLVSEYPGMTQLKLEFGVPGTNASGALVNCSATWFVNGVADKLERTIPIRVNKGMGCDAILGKATRKLLASVYGRLTGSEHGVPEGDVMDAEHVKVGDNTAKQLSQQLSSAASAPVVNGRLTTLAPEPLDTTELRMDEVATVDEYYDVIKAAKTIGDVKAHGDTAANSSRLSDKARQYIAAACDTRIDEIRGTRGQGSNG